MEYKSSILIGSTCINADSVEKQYLLSILKQQVDEATLIYRGSRDGFMSKDFHQKCDYHKNTVTLYKVNDEGPCLGGFTQKYWTSPSDSEYIEDPMAILFNLTDEILFPVREPKQAIMCDKDYGPCFGRRDLMTRYQPFNKVNGCKSITASVYGIDLDNYGTNMLSGSDDECFTIEDMEVWQLKFCD